MKKKIQTPKFHELIKKIEVLKENEKSQLKGGFVSIALTKEMVNDPQQPNTNTNNSWGCSCHC